MAPTKVVNTQNKPNVPPLTTRRGITTRNQKTLVNNALTKPPVVMKDPRIKRKADASPLKDKTTKRSALGNITNAIGKSFGVQHQEPKKLVKKAPITQVKPLIQNHQSKGLEKINVRPDHVAPKTKITTRAKSILKDEEKVDLPSKTTLINTRRSQDLEKSEDSSLYVSALEEVPEDSAKKATKTINKVESEVKDSKTSNETEDSGKVSNIVLEEPLIAERLDVIPERELPPGVQWDFDAENWRDPYQVSQYAMEIFEYLKGREKLFVITDYMERQVCLSRWMRSLLVDWMVEVQESFELNHETLYLAVKLVDLYLTKVTVGKETLQLLGAASLFIASKFDERIPPMVEDFLYICDGAYSQRELIRMEMNVLKIVDFDLGIPLSYRFLRRYARCAKVSMPTLTLARYILEYSLMDYSTIMHSDSKMAGAALFLALQMKDLGGWTPTLEYYTGYKLEDIKDIAIVLNQGLHRKHKDALATVRNKYSHKIFFEVAKVPLKEVLDI
ncbi:G2/mitotic-specific cyclin-B3 [Venturia canescens]|uniref:G2/mitotic-specific cyclin-B3 n=1 Tax=Venturia canescens TaxID=32260 RepID=UPI001C9C54C1|nr:G2/mitotic-specific cyclin-B3 [Venturia canescens]XP_043284433.1 G2/mitotic-specific cyclin-B3 [Venturia canescens]XP_043284434.1 G2/mitotic-specific cyclin-B3 [Venturia canescens]XP_043284435.1 G2/mitotic-specific cyclin-B3 [Venturia canescens]XP_043284436.1 G2/mitotic-specific cyclin-B3 [Venturia canescens]XP_043284437.1 G2/mitotic-specific cyclin-B3 [Venturia canescens]